MKLEVTRDPQKFDYYTSEDEARFVELIKQTGAVSLFLYSKNVLTRDGIRALGGEDKKVRAIARSGVMYVPVSFFTDFLKVPEDKLGGGDPLPLVATCDALGIYVKTYNEGLFAVVGGERIDAEIKQNPRLVYAGGYATLGRYDASRFTSADYKAAKDRWREAIAGSPALNDVTDPDIKQKIDAVNARCKRLHEGLHREPDAYCLYGTKKPTDSVDLLIQYAAVEGLALGYATYGSDYYHDEKILADTLYGLRWMYENMYGEAEMENRGWRSAYDYDWWHWFVGGVEPLTNALLLVEDHLTMEEKETYLKCFKWITTFMRTGYYQNCATSRIRVCTKTALLLEDPEWLENEFYDYDLLTEINESGDGCHIDYVNWTHSYPYNMTYGHNNLSRVLFVGALLGGTPVEFTSPKQYNLFKMAKYMFEPVHYRGRGFIIFRGRGVHGPEWENAVETNAHLLPMIGLYGDDEDEYIKRMIKRNSVMKEVVEGTKRICAIKELAKYIEILRDDSIPFDNDYEIGHSYFTGDRAVQQRNDYAFCVALASERHPSYESINGGNKIGWYSGDGALYLYTNNDSYTFDGRSFLFNEKLAYNIPGTTVDSRKRIPWSHYSGFKNPRSFAGSLSESGKYLVAAMDYESYNYRGKTEPDVDVGHGGGFLYHENDLVAKKSYFLFDRECVCLGAGISSTMNSPVKTVVEDRNLVLERDGAYGAERTLVDGEELPLENFAERVYRGPRWAMLEGVAGYVFLKNDNVSVEKFESKSGIFYKEGGSLEEITYDRPARFFKIAVEHGENPTDASYAYAILPYAAEDALEAYSASPEVEIISNASDVQAVRKRSLGITFYVFHSRGACEEIEVSEPCIVSVAVTEGEYRLTVCDPTQKLSQIKINVNKHLHSADADDKVSVKLGEACEITVDTTRSVGRPYAVKFKSF